MNLLASVALGAAAPFGADSGGDPHSHAEPDKVLVDHLDLELGIDFERQRLEGVATLHLDWQRADAGQLVLDVENLAIASVQALDATGQGTALDFELTDAVPLKGASMLVSAPHQPERVRIVYTTAPDASGLQWLAPEQTADKQLPFLFSQSEAIHARSWMPVQDSPAIRFTWAARVRVREDVRVVMSAPSEPDHALDGDYRFRQQRPVPAYLLAIAAGGLAVRETGPRSAVYAEPSVADSAAAEFEDTERMIQATEALYGAYPWGRYDLLVLPPSFPYGGMENPNMTFATPTVLVGDKSLVSLVAHELAHSWSGNLVTNAVWRDCWLNEGFTTYVQGRITEALYGQRQADEEALLDIGKLYSVLPAMDANARKLVREPSRTEADDELSYVAYHKGSWFLRTLEARFGRDVFDAWIQAYFEHFAWHSIRSEQMLGFLKAELFDRHPGKMDWSEVEQWMYGTDVPADAPRPDVSRFDAIDAARGQLLAGELGAQALQAGDWNTQEWMYFLDGLPDAGSLETLRALDQAWRLAGTPNAEIGMRWYVKAIGAGDQSVWPAADEHLTRIGRMYLNTPVYKAFAQTEEGLAHARALYERVKAGYHPLTRRVVERLFAQA